jgi:hypothetical protein
MRNIITMCNGTRYRSRLEARWAEFFRLLGWCAFYEPFDLDGYIPDFVLHGSKERILVEVKPVTGMDDPLFKETAAKIEKSGWKHEALIVSYFLPQSENYPDAVSIGWLTECAEQDAEDAWWEEAPFHHGGGLGFHHGGGNWRNRITGFYDGDDGTFSNDPRIEDYWREAGNTRQWRAA